MDLAEAIVYARKVAFRMSRDPEMESIAGRAAWRAVRTYNGKLRDPKRWVARLVRQGVWNYWRYKARIREEQHDLALELAPAVERDTPLDIPQHDFQLLWERYVDKWPLDVIASRHGVPRLWMKRMLALAMERLQDAL